MRQAAESARVAATHEENKPENDKDTRGLEAGYLAGAQAERALELNRTRDLLMSLAPRAFAPDERIAALALVEVEDTDSGERSTFFIVPVAGGKKITVEKTVVAIVSPASPFGDAVMGKRVGDVVEVPLGKKTKEFEIVSLA
jgi:transcription elongation GreA/GreB family factor